jgi:hypothetical protein
MNSRINVRTAFAPEVAFAVDTEPAEPTRVDTRAELAALKEKMVTDVLNSTPVLKLERLVKLAGDEAAGLAMTTGFPLLTFPTLFNELINRLRLQQKHQQHVAMRSELMLQEVA